MSDLLFQDNDWALRWLVVDTGDWLSGRRLLLPISALGEPDPDAHHLPVNLTLRQIEQGPDFDSSEPLSEETDTAALAHYHFPHGEDRFIWCTQAEKAAAWPDGDTAVLSMTAAGSETGVDPIGGHVRSLAEITGGVIEASDGDIGHAEDFLIDTAMWHVRYLVVHTSSWWVGEKTLVSPQSIAWIDWARRNIHLDVTRQKVKDSPPYNARQTVDGAFESLFHSYYGFRGPRR